MPSTAYSGQGQMDSNPQKRQSTGDGGPPPKKFKGAPELPGDYSDAVRRRYQSASRTGQACDRCKERKMRCDANASGCSACQQKNLRCVTTDRITGRATERGQADRLEVELTALKRHLAVYVNKYGHLDDAELAASNAYQDLPTAPIGGYGSLQHEQPFDQQNNPLTSSRGSDRPCHGPINGTVVDIGEGELDVAAFNWPDMAESEFGSAPIYNQSMSSFVRTLSGHQRPEKPALPPREEAFASVFGFLGTVNTYVPVLHGPTTLELLRKIYDHPEYVPSRIQMVIIILILANYNYQVAIRNPAVAKEKMKDSHHMFHYGLSVMCELWLDGSLEAMQGMALLLLHARCLPKPAYTWHLSTHVLNKLIDAGYHRSSSELGLQESPLALEMRKRVFWAVLGINVETGSKLGRPMPMRMDDIGVELPTALEDSEISENGIAPSRSGRCAFWAGVYVSKLVPYLIDLYNNFISVRRPPSDYLKNLETLNAKIVDFRQNWTKDTSVEPQGPSIKAATHHVDSWAAEFQLILHHPHLCTTTSPEVMEKNLDQCHQAADRLLNNATALFNIYRGVDFTWYSTVGYVLAFGVTLQIHRQRKDQLTRERFNAMKKELTDWLTIMGVADRVLRTGELYHRTFKPQVDKVLGEAQAALVANSAMPNGYPKGPDIQRNGLQSTVNQTQAPAPQYVQSNGYAAEAYKTASTSSIPGGESGQGLTGSVPSAPPPPLVYSGPWQYPQINHTRSEAEYQPTSNRHGHVYGGSAVDYHNDAPQLPHMSPSMLGSGNYMAYQPHGSDQHADALLPLSAWDDSNAATLWPHSIMIMPHQQHLQQPQQPQQPQQQQ